MYQACIFDLDGTLVNTLRSIAYFSNAALRAFGYPAIPEIEYRTIVGDGADVQVRRMLDRAAGKDAYSEADFQKVRSRYGELYGGNPTYLAAHYPGMPEAIRRLKALGVKTAVLSNKPDEWAGAIIGALFPRGSFDRCYGKRPGIPRKPSPEGALLTVKELGVKPRCCLYVGDTNTDMKTGAAAGMDTAGVLWGFRNRKELEGNHAKYILGKPEDLDSVIAGDGAR